MIQRELETALGGKLLLGEVRAFMQQCQGLLQRMAIELGPEDKVGDPLEAVLSDHLGVAADLLPVVTEDVAPHRQAAHRTGHGEVRRLGRTRQP